MRAYIKLTENTQLIPYNYQPYLTGAIHKWIGQINDEHGKLSLYSFSWLQNLDTRSKKGVNLTENSYFFVSAHDESLIKQVVKGILRDPLACFGSIVTDVQISNTPVFSNSERFLVGSPVFIKRRLNNNEKHITYDHPQCNDFLTETLQKKMQEANLPSEGVRVRFDVEYMRPRTKIIHYKNIGNRVNLCPVIIEGTPEQIGFAWNVGVGNSTGIGFGSLL